MRRSAGPARAAAWAHGQVPEEAPAPAAVSPLGPLEPEKEAPPKIERVPRKNPGAATETTRVPIDPVNEQVILAVAIVSREHRVRLLAQFAPDAFHAKGHAEAWSALGELERLGLAYDPATIAQISGSAVDVAYLEQLVRQRPEVPPNLVHHIDALRWDNNKIAIARGPLAALLETLRDPAANPERVKSLAKQVGEGFSSPNTQAVRDPAALLRESETVLDEREAGRACYPIGIQGLDHDGTKWLLVPGAAPQKITLLVGVSSSGKSSTAIEVLLAQVQAKRRVLLGAWEMGSNETINLMAGREIGMSRDRLMSGKFQEGERKMLRDAKEWILEYVRFFDHPAATNRSSFRAAVERQSTKYKSRSFANDVSLGMVEAVLAETGADIFVGDLWKRVLRTSNPDEEEQVLCDTQDLAKRSGAHLFLVHQINLKSTERETDKRPTRDLIKGNGAWVEVADTIIATYRPAQFKAVADETVQYFVLKQRYGRSPFVVECKYDPDTGRVWAGKEIAYQPVGEAAPLDEFLEGANGPRFGNRGGNKGGRRKA